MQEPDLDEDTDPGITPFDPEPEEDDEDECAPPLDNDL